jgi:hypothetical protein
MGGLRAFRFEKKKILVHCREIRIYAAQLLFQNGNGFNLDQEIFAG